MRHTEDNLQVACKKWFDLQYRAISKLLFHVPNGGHRNIREAARFKKSGVVAGVSDLILLKHSGDRQYSSLCIELKAGKGKQTEAQKRWQELAELHGNKYVVCRSFDEFREAVNDYLFTTHN